MNRVDVRELECFVAVADHLNFSRAARQLHISQPPLTRHIQALEEKLGTKVFTRNTHAVALTESGAIFLEDARAILRHLDRALDTLHRARSGQTIRLRLAFIGALLDQKLVQLIQRFQKSYGCYQVQVTDLAPAAQLEAIQSGDLDGGFIGAKPAKPIKDVEFAEWHQEPLVLALPESHPLAKIKSLRWENLKSLLWVMVSRQAAPAFRDQFAGIIERQSLQARIIEESDRVPAVLTMVAAGSGVSMVPQSVQHLVTGGIAFRPLPSPVPLLNYVFAFRSGEKSQALSDFVKLFDQSRRGKRLPLSMQQSRHGLVKSRAEGA
jgi:DNA-binding transcriptional LysR family regulator